MCSAYDLGEKECMPDIRVNQWVDFKGMAKVIYLKRASLKKVKHLFLEVAPDTVYVNGLFSLVYNIYPLLLRKRFSSSRFVVAPRGMLQAGALEVKALKKSVFLRLFKLSGVHQQLYWHATDKQEEEDIRKMMGTEAKIVFAEVTPNLSHEAFKRIDKAPGSLKLVFISLLTAKKNIKYLLNQLTGIEHAVHVDIYGPIKDKDYWKHCEAIIGQLPAHVKVRYLGALHPDQVSDTLRKYHFFVLPTLGENFGHAIYEALNVGRPVIISDRTPWRNLQAQQAGWDFSLEDEDDFPSIIEQCIQMDQESYDAYCRGAQEVARKYVAEAGFETKYQRLFGLID